MNNKVLISLVLLFAIIPLKAQINTGSISGSFQSRTHYYFNDPGQGVIMPSDPFASNNYLWLQYKNGPVSIGMQYEAYMPPLQGFPYQREGNAITHRYLRFTKKIIDVTAGNFYEQFGSGLSFRSYEERALGINNSIDGFRLILEPVEGIKIKTIYGKPARFLEKADAYIRGFDAETDIAKFFDTNNSYRLGAGLISRYNPYIGPEFDYPETVYALNTRAGLDIGDFSLEGEYVSKSADPDILNFDSRDKGKAILVKSSYNTNGLGIYLSARLLDKMNFLAERESGDGFNNINYLPSNSRQYTYMLSNLYPYTTQAEGEISIQADISYTLIAGSKSGKRSMHNFRFNFADIRGGDGLSLSSIGNSETEKYYGDLNLEINSRWSKQLKTNFSVQKIYFNRGQVEGLADDIIESNIVVADMSVRVSRKISFRSEIQHLWTNDDQGNWFAILTEFNLHPGWSLYASDMINYEYSDPTHYYNYGLSYNANYFRISIAYGRNREGYICAGGVCRKIPAYKGINLSFTTSF